MEFADYKRDVIDVTPESEGLLYDLYRFIYREKSPVAVCALGSCAEKVIKIPNMSKEERAIQDMYGPYKLTGKPVPVRTFYERKFFKNTDITDIILQSSIIEIPEYAFRGCRKLKRITIPKSICEIKRCTFEDCVSLEDVYVAGSPTRWSKVKIDMRERDINDQYFWDNYDCLSDEIAGNQALLKARIHFNYEI